MSSLFTSPQYARDHHTDSHEMTTELEIRMVKLNPGGLKVKPKNSKHPQPKVANKEERDPSQDNHSPCRTHRSCSDSSSTEEGSQKAPKKVKKGKNRGKVQPDVQKSYQQKFKTEMCKNYELQGSCRWGESCSYAHGPEELRQKTHLNTNYRSKICKLYHRQGGCPYGLR